MSLHIVNLSSAHMDASFLFCVLRKLSQYMARLGLMIITILPVAVHSQDTVLINDNFTSLEPGLSIRHKTGTSVTSFWKNPSKWFGNNGTNVLLSRNEHHLLFLCLTNHGRSDRSLILSLNNAQLGESVLYIEQDGRLDSAATTGSLVAKKRRALPDRTMAFPLDIGAGNTIGVYIATARNEINIAIKPVLTDPSRVDLNRRSDYLVLMVLAILLLVLLAAITGVYYVKIPETWWFLAFVSSVLLYVISGSGLGSLYYWPGMPWFEENSMMIFAAASTITFLQFGRSIIRAPVAYPRFNRMISGYIATYGLVALLGFSMYPALLPGGSLSLILNCLHIFLLLLMLVMLEISFYNALVMKLRHYWWYIATVICYGCFIASCLLFATGIMEYRPVVYNLTVVCGVLPPACLMLIFMINRMLAFVSNRNNEIARLRLKNTSALVDERLRVGKELHDEIGSLLKNLTGSNQLAKEQLHAGDTSAVSGSLNSIETAASEMSGKLDDMVWLLTPGQDNVSSLVSRLESYAAALVGTRNMQVIINLNGDIGARRLTFDHRRQIYLIAREAINNAILYSEGSLLQLVIGTKQEMLDISIIDNGKGFEQRSITKGKGLENMKMRAGMINAMLCVDSAIGKGAKILLQVKIS